MAHKAHEAVAKLVAPLMPKLPAAQGPSGTPRFTPLEQTPEGDAGEAARACQFSRTHRAVAADAIGARIGVR